MRSGCRIGYFDEGIWNVVDCRRACGRDCISRAQGHRGDRSGGVTHCGSLENVGNTQAGMPVLIGITLVIIVTVGWFVITLLEAFGLVLDQQRRVRDQRRRMEELIAAQELMLDAIFSHAGAQ